VRSRVIPVIVTHPCTLFRDGLRRIFARSPFRLVYVAADLDEASIKYLPSAKTCVWLIGLERYSASAYDFVRRMRSASPEVKTVILAQHQTAADVLPAIDAGASGFLSPDISCERLIKSLELIALGETVVPSEYLQAIRSGMTRPMEVQPPRAEHGNETPARHLVHGYTLDGVKHPTGSGSEAAIAKTLSRREEAILRLLMGGASNKIIARQLVITEATVKVHIKAILRKLRLHNRTQAAMWASNHLGRDGGRCDSLQATTLVSAMLLE
jgi:two-component system, NarL family, nitrate/nitrite response regulator NarL